MRTLSHQFWCRELSTNKKSIVPSRYSTMGLASRAPGPGSPSVPLLVFLIIRVFASAPLAHQTFHAILGRPTASRAFPVGANFVAAPPIVAIGLHADFPHFADLV